MAGMFSLGRCCPNPPLLALDIASWINVHSFGRVAAHLLDIPPLSASAIWGIGRALGRSDSQSGYIHQKPEDDCHNRERGYTADPDENEPAKST